MDLKVTCCRAGELYLNAGILFTEGGRWYLKTVPGVDRALQPLVDAQHIPAICPFCRALLPTIKEGE